jgi:antitoxin YefM
MQKAAYEKPFDESYAIPYNPSSITYSGDAMTNLTATEARSNLYRLIDDVALSHRPIRIAGKRHNAILISEDDWQAVQETLYLLNIPGMRESIIEGMNTPIEMCDEELEW